MSKSLCMWLGLALASASAAAQAVNQNPEYPTSTTSSDSPIPVSDSNDATSAAITQVLQQIVLPGPGIINTVAGNGTAGYSGDGGIATSAKISTAFGIGVDASGNIYIPDQANNRIRKVTASTGVISTVAGNGTAGYSGDGGAATNAMLGGYVDGVALDASGNIYIADFQNNRIRKVKVSTGIITTLAGNGTAGYAGDNGAASSAKLNGPVGVAVDSSGNIYISDSNNYRIRKVTTSTGIITTVAGNGTTGYSGDGGIATSAKISSTQGIWVDASGNIYIADRGNGRIRKVTASTGIISTAAGGGSGCTQQIDTIGDGCPASAGVISPAGVAVDSSSNIYIADAAAQRIRRVSASDGIITTVAGNGTAGYSGDGGLATSAMVNSPSGVAVDTTGNIYIADYSNHRIRMEGHPVSQSIAFTAMTSPVAYGVLPITLSATASSGLPVTFSATGPATVSDGTLTIIGVGTVVVTASQAGSAIYSAATQATQNIEVNPGLQAITFTPPTSPASYPTTPIMLVASSTSGLPVTFSATGPATVSGSVLTTTGFGTVTVTASQTGNSNYLPATQVAQSIIVNNHPTPTLVVATSRTPSSQGGSVTFTATISSGPTGTLTFYDNNISIGSGTISGTAATFATSTLAAGMHIINAGWLGNADYNPVNSDPITQVVEYFAIPGPGIIATIVGDGTAGYFGDGGPPLSAKLNSPSGVAVDASGNIYIADKTNQRIRKITASTGLISTVVGNGTAGYSGDGGLAITAKLNNPSGVAVDTSGNIYIADNWNNRIRMVTVSTGVISTVAGNGISGSSGDGGAAISARLSSPSGVAVDASGNIYIADYGNSSVRKVSISTGTISTVQAQICPSGVTVDASGNVYIVASCVNKVYEIPSSTGVLTAVAQGLNSPNAVAADASGNIYIADKNNSLVRKVTVATGFMTTVAGNSTPGYSGDGGAAISAKLNFPSCVALDPSGNIYIADTGNNRIRLVGNLLPQTVTFLATTSPVSYEVASITLSATASSGLPVTFSVTGPATVSGGTLTITGVGTVVVMATQAGNSQYVATGVSHTILVTPAPQAIAFVAPTSPITYGLAPTTLLATASSGLPITFTTSGPATIIGSTLTITGVGTVEVTASQAGNANYTAAQPISYTIVVNPISQTITSVAPPTPVTYGVFPISMSATASSGLPVSFTAVGPAIVRENILLITGGGTVVVTVSQAGNAYYAAAPDIFWTILVNPAPQSITFSAPTSPVSNSVAPIALEATASSGLPVTFTATGPGTVSGNTLTITDVGIVAVTASQNGNANFAAATQVTQNVAVNNLPTPTLTVTTSGSPSNHGGSVTFTATITSGSTGTVAFFDDIVLIGTGTISSTTARFTTSMLTAGIHTISARYAGNANYNPAISTAVTQTVEGIAAPGSGVITTVAGNGREGYSGDGGLASTAELRDPGAIAIDSAGNVYVSDSNDYRIRKVSVSTGIITTVAGTGTFGYSGDGGAAISAKIGYVTALAVDSLGNLFIDDSSNCRIRKVSTSTGNITTVAGNGTCGYGGTGGLATQAQIYPIGLAVDSSGNLYFGNAAPGTSVMEKVISSSGVISLIPGLAAGSPLVDAGGSLYIATSGFINRVSSTTGSVVGVVAGNGTTGHTGDNGPAINAEVDPSSMMLDQSGNIYFWDRNDNSVRTITASTGIISVAAEVGGGNGCAQQTDSVGDGCLAIDGIISRGFGGTAVDGSGNIYFADWFNRRVRVVSPIPQSQTQQPTIEVACSPESLVYGSGSACNISTTSNTSGTVSLVYVNTSFDEEDGVIPVTFGPTLSLAARAAHSAMPSSLSAGTYDVFATYNGDSTNLPAVATASIIITPAPLTITWPTPSTITYGTRLSSLQLNAYSTIPGVFVYTPPPGTVLPVGSYTLSSTFYPDDAVDYAHSVTATVPLSVTERTPSIIWPTPSSIQYGTPLSNAQLNATANVPGTFTYTPSAGTVLPIGLQTLNVLFTPTASVYNTSNADVSGTTQVTVSADTPLVTSVFPNPAAVGTAVTIVGQNFGPTQGSGTVMFNGIAASAGSWSDKSIVTAVPPGASTGSIVVTVSGTPSNSFLFMVPISCGP